MEGTDIIVTNKSNDYLINFELINANNSLANAIRRTCLSEVETIGFKTEPYEESDVNIIENTSSLHNEFIMHRFGMIPVNFSDIDKFDSDRYRFILNVQNTSSKILNVTTKDIVVKDLNTNTNLNTDDFFPPDKYTNEYILITKLKPNPNGVGEKLNLEARAIKSSGSENARWSPVSKAVFNNKIDVSALNIAIEKFLLEKEESKGTPLTADEKEKFTNSFTISEGERYFHVDNDPVHGDEPNIFEFTIESIGILTAGEILNKSLYHIKTKLDKFLANLDKYIETSENDSVQVIKSDTVQKAFDIKVIGENHTLGNLIQTYTHYLNSPELNFIGYFKPHPLYDHIIIRIGVADNSVETVRKLISKTVVHIKDICSKLDEKTREEFSLKQKTRKLKKKEKLK